MTTKDYTVGQKTFRIGEKVRIGPDFSNDDFEAFEAVIVEFDLPLVRVRAADGDESEWITGNMFKIEQ